MSYQFIFSLLHSNAFWQNVQLFHSDTDLSFRYVLRPRGSWSRTYTGCSTEARTVSSQQFFDDFVYDSRNHVHDLFTVSFYWAFNECYVTCFKFRYGCDSWKWEWNSLKTTFVIFNTVSWRPIFNFATLEKCGISCYRPCLFRFLFRYHAGEIGWIIVKL